MSAVAIAPTPVTAPPAFTREDIPAASSEPREQPRLYSYTARPYAHRQGAARQRAERDYPSMPEQSVRRRRTDWPLPLGECP
jgi:hypothetical protein